MTASIPPIQSLLDLNDRTIVVTGASGNIGAGIAHRIAQAGANTVIHYNSQAGAAEDVAAKINATGGRAAAIGADLSDAAAPDRLITESAERFGTVFGLVNNAGIQPVEGFMDITDGSFDSMMRTNVGGPFALIQSLARNAQNGGAVVNIASIEGSQPAAFHSHYAVSKAALIMATRAAALELGSGGIRVNCVSPGLIHRDGIEEDWPEGVGRWKAAAPLERLGQPEDIGDAVLFLLSDAARWITGVNLPVDGGVLAHPTW